MKLEISGEDLLAAGVAEGPEIGARLRAALDAKLEGRVCRARGTSCAPRSPTVPGRRADRALERTGGLRRARLGSGRVMSDRNAMRWDGSPGHYEVWYVSLTDRGSGAGAWVRLTMRAPEAGAAECSLWFMAMTPSGERVARKRTFPIAALKRRRRAVPAPGRRRRAVGPRQRRGDRRRALGAALGARRRQRRDRPPAARARADRAHDDGRAAARSGDRGHDRLGWTRDRAVRRARRPDAPLGRQARLALVLAARQRPRGARRRAARAATGSSRCPSSRRAPGARSARARR